MSYLSKKNVMLCLLLVYTSGVARGAEEAAATPGNVKKIKIILMVYDSHLKSLKLYLKYLKIYYNY